MHTFLCIDIGTDDPVSEIEALLNRLLEDFKYQYVELYPAVLVLPVLYIRAYEVRV